MKNKVFEKICSAVLFWTGVSCLAVCCSSPTFAEESLVSPVLHATTGTERLSDSDVAGGDLFGSRRGHMHPFLFLSEQYSDNLFNVSDHEEDDFLTILSPGLWLAFPADDRQPLSLQTISSVPGGVAVTRFPVERLRRLQGYALYRADIFRYQDFSDEDTVYHRGEGLLNLNLRGGLSFELVDIFEIKRDPYSTGVTREIDEIASNLIQLSTNFRVSEKTRLRADISHYQLDFDADRNAFREREDSVLALYLLYRFLPRTSFLLEYDFIDIDYRQKVVPDSQGREVFAGLRWEASEKSTATVKLGHSWRELKRAGSREDFIGEIRLDYRFTPKTSMAFALTRRVEETDIATTSNVLSHRAQLLYRQKLAPRLFTNLDLFFNRKDYRAASREDDLVGATISFGYLFRPWLTFGAGYSYEDNDSSSALYDYSANTVYLSATAAL